MIELLPFQWDELRTWYLKYGRIHLPWRNYSQFDEKGDSGIYTIWLSEIFLQQTQAERVIPYLEKVLNRFPDIISLGSTDYDTFFPYYEGLGYYSRARNLLLTAKIISEQYNGKFPNDEKILNTLPGVGPYTSRAILAFGYKHNLLAWDTNLEKVFSRFYYGSKYSKLSKSDKDFIENSFLQYSTGKGGSNISRDINNALMDYARMIEIHYPKNSLWEDYPLKDSLFYKNRGENEVTITKIKEYFPIPDATIVVILHENHRNYYSSQKEQYEPFILTGIGERDTRKFVKDNFKKRLGIDVSVRPIHKKWFENNIPHVAVYAQIQRGNIPMYIFPKTTILGALKKYQK